MLASFLQPPGDGEIESYPGIIQGQVVTGVFLERPAGGAAALGIIIGTGVSVLRRAGIIHFGDGSQAVAKVRPQGEVPDEIPFRTEKETGPEPGTGIIGGVVLSGGVAIDILVAAGAFISGPN